MFQFMKVLTSYECVPWKGDNFHMHLLSINQLSKQIIWIPAPPIFLKHRESVSNADVPHLPDDVLEPSINHIIKLSF